MNVELWIEHEIVNITELLIFLLYESSKWLQMDFCQCKKTCTHTQVPILNCWYSYYTKATGGCRQTFTNAKRLLSILRVTTCLENLKMSGNLSAVREMSGILPNIREISGKKSCQGKVAENYCKLHICVSIQVFSTSTGMIWVTLNTPSAVNRQGISHCLERSPCLLLLWEGQQLSYFCEDLT